MTGAPQDQSDNRDDDVIQDVADEGTDRAETAAAPELSPLEAAVAERDDLKNLLLRTHAELDNFRKRMNRERDEERRYASLPVVRDLLPVLDNLQRAIQAGEAGDENNALLSGVKMVSQQIEEVLSRHHAQPIESLGLPFDPNFHEALQQVPTSEHPPLTVIQELERGYKIHDRVIRPSKVIVSAAPSG